MVAKIAALLAIILTPIVHAAPVQQLGGETTVHMTGVKSFNTSARNIHTSPEKGEELAHDLTFQTGNSLFNTSWVTAGSSVVAKDGLGPLFNATSCESCHIEDGKGSVPVAELPGPEQGLLLRISRGLARSGAVIIDPIYGGQLQDRAILGVKAEAVIKVAWQHEGGRYADGKGYSLRRPVWTLTEPGYGPFAPDLQISARLAPIMIGLGLLENVPETDILSREDPEDGNKDGIRGKASRVTEKGLLGRFGWKAEQPTVIAQSTAAFNGDIGLTSFLAPDLDCTPVEKCASLPNGTDPGERYELKESQVKRLEVYTKLLAVPERRSLDSAAGLLGEGLFARSGCGACHVQTLTTGVDPHFPELSRQTIHPFTDLLLHDMGEGLSDHRPVWNARGSDWRTAPLWGLGLVQTVNPKAGFLHDGRARTIEEAILWHGGEAQGARDRFAALPEAQREALLTFLQSL